MLDLVQPYWLNALGAAFALLGTAVLFLDLKGDSISSKATDVQAYIGRLDQQIEDLAEQPKERGFKTPEGVDIGEAFDLLYQAAKIANRKNRGTYLGLLDEVKAEAQKHRRALKTAIALVILGGCLQVIAAFM
jgi:hypothetical protein